MKNYKGVLIRLCIVIVVLLIIAIVWIFVNRDSSSDFVVYEHDKLYSKYLESNPVEWESLGEDLKAQSFVLVENERFEVRCAKTINKIDVVIHDKVSEEYYLAKTQMLGVDASGDTVCTYFACGENMYYNPFKKEFESGIRFVEINEDKLIIDILLIQDFFSSDSYNSHMPRFMTVEDFESFSETVDYDLNNAYKLTNSEDMSFEDSSRLFGEDERGIPGVKMNMFFSDFYLKRMLSVRMGYLTPEIKRQCEAKFVRKGYEAPMVIARFIIDISGEELRYDSEIIENISPKNSKVSDIIVKSE